MSNINAFVDKVAASSQLQQAVADLTAKKDGSFVDDLVKVARKEGVQLSEEDAKVFAVAAFGGPKLGASKSGELSDAALDKVSGGASSVFQFAVGTRQVQIDRSLLNTSALNISAIKSTLDRIGGFNLGRLAIDVASW